MTMITSGQQLARRMVRAALADTDLYAELARDSGAIRQSFLSYPHRCGRVGRSDLPPAICWTATLVGLSSDSWSRDCGRCCSGSCSAESL